MSNKSRGTKRERDRVKMLRADGYSAIRTPGSLGVMDVIALKAGLRPRYEQVKTDPYPYQHFGPAERRALLAEAERAGADAFLCHWPPDRRGPRFILPSEWPRDVSADIAVSTASAS